MFKNKGMIQGFGIENFKCFHKTEIHGFARINLFGGKNNVGKTSFLEALYSALNQNMLSILSARPNNLVGDDAYKYLFYNINNADSINFEVFEQDLSYKISWAFQNSGFGITPESFNKYSKNNKVSFILSKESQFPEKLSLSKEFDTADIKGESDLILQMLQIIDPSVQELKTYASFPETLFLRKKNEKNSLPLSNYGDALQKMLRYVITIVKFEAFNGREKKILLIDEIENGLHYTTHRDFWQMLFKLAVAYDIQIFAATHSREMIESFADIAQKPEFLGQAAYFEMFRHFKTGEIAANKIQPESLEYKLENDKPLRGE